MRLICSHISLEICSPHGAGIFSCGGDAGDDGARVLLCESDELHHGFRRDLLVILAEQLLILERGKHGLPVLVEHVGVLILEVEHELHVDIEDARIGLRAFDIAT